MESCQNLTMRLRLWGAFHHQLRELGYVEGQNITIESRWAQGKSEGLPALAAELVRHKVHVLVTAGTPAALAAQRATRTIPIIMATSISVVTGLSDRRAGPGGNVTGLSDLAPGQARNSWSCSAKWFRRARPSLSSGIRPIPSPPSR